MILDFFHWIARHGTVEFVGGRMTGGGGDRWPPPVMGGGGMWPVAVGNFGFPSGSKVGDLKGLVDCYSPAAGEEVLGACIGLEEDLFGVIGGELEGVDGRLYFSDGEEMEVLTIVGDVGVPTEVCMGLDGEVHGDAHVRQSVGARYLLQSKFSQQVLDHSVEQGNGSICGGNPLGGALGSHLDVSNHHKQEKDIMQGVVMPVVMKGDSCTQGARVVVSEKVLPPGGGWSAPNASGSSPGPVRAAWSQPMVVPLPMVVPSGEVWDGVDRVRLELEEVDATMKLFKYAWWGGFLAGTFPLHS